MLFLLLTLISSIMKRWIKQNTEFKIVIIIALMLLIASIVYYVVIEL